DGWGQCWRWIVSTGGDERVERSATRLLPRTNGPSDVPTNAHTADGSRSAPPALAWGQVGLYYVGIQLDAESGFIRQANESVLNVRLVEDEHLVHPVALAGDGLASHVVADGSRPVDGGPGVDLAAGVVIRHRQREYLGHV